MLFQQENFFNNLDYILPELHKIKLYSKKEYDNEFPNNGQLWPGYRSADLTIINPILTSFVLDKLQNVKILQNQNLKIHLYLHLRTKEDEKDEFIHTDDDFYKYGGLIYLNDTNLNSGTKIYEDKDQMINDIKYVKNRLIIFNGSYRHKGYGYFGNNSENGRLTLNLFIRDL